MLYNYKHLQVGLIVKVEMGWEEVELFPAGSIFRKMGQGRMHQFNIFKQVDGKAGRKRRCCNLEGS